MFIAVISAFALNNWNDNKNNRQSEQKILLEIRNSIDNDLHDFQNNIGGNKISLRANDVFRQLIDNQSIPQDSIGLYYVTLFRDYAPIINKSAYDSFKANNLKTITNDSLRIQIITLYDYYYSILEAIEYNIPEMQSYSNYFSNVNEMLHPYMKFNPGTGNLESIDHPKNLLPEQRKELLSYFWRIRYNREYKLKRYELIINEIEKVKENIEKELGD